MTLPLPISPADALARIINPALALLPAKLTSPSASVQLLSHALQEAGLRTREQIHGPARGLWQSERGGVACVLGNPATERLARSLCALRGVPATSYSVYTSLAGDDLLACGFARLMLFADPAPLPAMGDATGAWACYLRTWGPGKPRPDDWPANYALALRTVTGSVPA